MKKILLLSLAGGLLLSSCRTCPFAPASTPVNRVEHIVLVWLKKPGAQADRDKIIAASKELKASIPEVRRLSVGPALPSDRPVVDDSFDVALVMAFENPEDLARYEASSAHQKAVKETLGPLASKIVVHDISTR